MIVCRTTQRREKNTQKIFEVRKKLGLIIRLDHSQWSSLMIKRRTTSTFFLQYFNLCKMEMKERRKIKIVMKVGWRVSGGVGEGASPCGYSTRFKPRMTKRTPSIFEYRWNINRFFVSLLYLNWTLLCSIPHLWGKGNSYTRGGIA